MQRKLINSLPLDSVDCIMPVGRQSMLAASHPSSSNSGLCAKMSACNVCATGECIGVTACDVTEHGHT